MEMRLDVFHYCQEILLFFFLTVSGVSNNEDQAHKVLICTFVKNRITYLISFVSYSQKLATEIILWMRKLIPEKINALNKIMCLKRQGLTKSQNTEP